MSRLDRLVYRSRQFWLALTTRPGTVPTDRLSPYLSPAQLTLFRRLQPSEQAHAFLVLERLKEAGQTGPDLLTAALLHDIGKLIAPLTIWDRVLIVLVGRYLPGLAKRWSEGRPRGLRRPFVVAARHPDWGADLAAEAGASPRVLELIRRHQTPASADDPQSIALQAADDEA
jgi:hypothetical protein